MGLRRTFFLFVMVLISIVVGALAGLAARPYWWLGIGPAMILMVFSYLFLSLQEHSSALAKWRAWDNQMRREGKEPRYVDESVDIPPNGAKQYSVEMSQGHSLRILAMSMSDNILSADIVSSEEALKAKSGEHPVIEKRSFETKVVLMKFEPRHQGNWIVSIRNQDETPATVAVVIHYFGPPRD